MLISHDADEAIQDGGRTLAAPRSSATRCRSPPVMDIAANGEKVPRKSTSFGPKPRTGLVLRSFDLSSGRGRAKRREREAGTRSG